MKNTMRHSLIAIALVVVLAIFVIGNLHNAPQLNLFAVQTFEDSGISKEISPAEKVQLENKFTDVRKSSEGIPSALNTLITFANPKDVAKLTDLVRRMKRIYADNTIKTLLDEVKMNIENNDKNLDENIIQLGAEIKQINALSNQLSDFAQLNNDNYDKTELSALANDLNSKIKILDKEFNKFEGEFETGLDNSSLSKFNEYKNKIEAEIRDKFDGDNDNDGILDVNDTDDDNDGTPDLEDKDDNNDDINDSPEDKGELSEIQEH